MGTDTKVKRISPKEARRRLSDDSSFMLVCAYPQEAYDKSHLEGSISIDEFKSRMASLPTSAPFAFY